MRSQKLVTTSGTANEDGAEVLCSKLHFGGVRKKKLVLVLTLREASQIRTTLLVFKISG